MKKGAERGGSWTRKEGGLDLLEEKGAEGGHLEKKGAERGGSWRRREGQDQLEEKLAEGDGSAEE